MTNIVLVTVDSLRADHVGWHGYERDTTPNLDGLAESGKTFHNAYANACSTRPSFPAILTSSYPLMYGGYERLSEDRVTVAEELSAEGYSTAGFHSNLYLSADFGYDRGFDTFYDSKSDPSPLAKLRQTIKTHLDGNRLLYNLLQTAFNFTEKQAGIELGSAYVNAENMTDMAIEWAEQAGEGQRFLWVHYMDVHHPYLPPDKYQCRFRDEAVSDRTATKLRRKMLESPDDISDEELQTILDLYDAEIAYVDAEVSRLIRHLEDIWNDEVSFVFTADHGEEFLEHGGFSHSATFYNEVLHVPLLIRHDDLTGSSDDLIGLLDVAPTLVAMSGREPPENFEGENVLSAEDQAIRSKVIAEWSDLDTDDRRFGLRTKQWKYIKDESGGEKLFDVKADPREQTNLSESRPEIVDKMRSTLNRHQEKISETAEDLGDVDMEEDVRERLRDLGYQE